MELKVCLPGFGAARAVDLGRATRGNVNVRTQQLAVLAGRAPPYVTQADYQQAKRELTGETDLDRQSAILDGLPGLRAAHPQSSFRCPPSRAQVGYTP